MSRLLADARQILGAFEAGQDVEPDRVEGLVRRIRLVAKGMDPADLRDLVAVTKQLETVIQEHLDALAREIRQTNANRRALRGYGHLRAHATAQRVNWKG